MNRKMKYILSCFFILLTGSAAQSQANRIELSKTGKNHELLAGITGSWNFAGKHFSSDPAVKPIEFNGTAVRKAIMDGRYFIFETTGGKLVMPWSAGKEVTYTDMTIEGYDNTKKKFVNAFIGNHWNTGIAPSEGSYDSVKKAILYESEFESGPGMKTVIRNLLKIRDSDHYTVEIFMVNGGQQIKRSEINYTRIKDNFATKYHKLLARSTGTWKGKGTMQFAPDTPPVDAGTSELTNKMTLDGLYQISEIKGNTTPGMGQPWTGLRITGYDSARKVFTRAMIGDGGAAGGVGMEGPWDEATRTITMPFKKTDPSTGKMRDLKEVYKIIDENTEVLEIHATDEKTGKEFKMLNIIWTRQQ
jgi:hypothetical protein